MVLLSTCWRLAVNNLDIDPRHYIVAPTKMQTSLISHCNFLDPDFTQKKLIGADFQVSHGQPSTKKQRNFRIVQYVYTALFTIELGIRICADGCGLFWGDDWTWGWLDLFIVVFSLWEVGVAPWNWCVGER